jgi:hypothetical protein
MVVNRRGRRFLCPKCKIMDHGRGIAHENVECDSVHVMWVSIPKG